MVNREEIYASPKEKTPGPACVRDYQAGSAWEREKLETRKMLENATESHTSGAGCVRVSSLIIFDALSSIFASCFQNGAALSHAQTQNPS